MLRKAMTVLKGVAAEIGSAETPPQLDDESSREERRAHFLSRAKVYVSARA